MVGVFQLKAWEQAKLTTFGNQPGGWNKGVNTRLVEQGGNGIGALGTGLNNFYSWEGSVGESQFPGKGRRRSSSIG